MRFFKELSFPIRKHGEGNRYIKRDDVLPLTMINTRKEDTALDDAEYSFIYVSANGYKGKYTSTYSITNL